MTAQVTRLTPSASIRDQYYRKHGLQQRNNNSNAQCTPPPTLTIEDDDQQSDTTTTTITVGPLQSPALTDDADLVIDSRHREIDDLTKVASTRGSHLSIETRTSLQVESADNQETNCQTSSPTSLQQTDQQLFYASSSAMEPSILISKSNNIDSGSKKSITSEKSFNEKTSLLSRLSKTTAPMRAKLSAMSRTNSYLKPNMVASVSIPLRRSTDSTYHSSTTSALRISSASNRRSHGERAQSFSFEKSIRPSREMITYPIPSISTGSNSRDHQHIDPALLSQVAIAFKERVMVGTKIKDSIKYKDTFDGMEAVDKLTLLTKTKDRNLALLLGRALDAQRLFHDVNYEHRLRDSRQELYRFTEHINVRTPAAIEDVNDPINSATWTIEDDETSEASYRGQQPAKNDINCPNGVFTLLLTCYSPTCSREKLCYSVFCPRRLEQQERSSTQKSLRRSTSKSSISEKEDRLWATTVPKLLVDIISIKDRKRQENIYEFIYTEKDFVDDLVYLKTYWIQPLLTSDLINPPERREAFVRDLFWNILEIYETNSRFVEALQARQALGAMVHQVGDILLEHVAHFTPFVNYGAHQIIGKSIFQTEKSTNPEFAAYVEATERLPVSRKLELNAYLTRPTTRLGRYTLLLREILKHTPQNHPDQETIPKAIKIISEHLTNVNYETGKTENRFNLQLLAEKLQDSSPLYDMDLNLLAEDRQIVMKGPLKRKGIDSESLALQVYLLDHCLIITKQKFTDDGEQVKLYRKPIPIGLLAISLPDQTKRASVILPYGQHNTVSMDAAITTTGGSNSPGTKSGYPISFVHLGRHGTNPTTLYASSFTSRRQWVDKIESYRYSLTEKQKVVEVVPINNDFFNGLNKVNCATPFGGSILIGSDQGVYLISHRKVTRLLDMDKVSQIEILENKFILILADKTLYTYGMDLLDDNTNDKPTDSRGRKLSNHVSFFKVGTVMDKSSSSDGVERSLVCYVRYNAMTSTIRALEIHDASTTKSKKKKTTATTKEQGLRRKTTAHFGSLLRPQHDGLRVFKDLYIPGEATSIQYFKNILCIGSAKGFQMVDIGSAGVLSVLDPEDKSHTALASKYDLRPISMFRHPDKTILLCYHDLAFYINKKGQRARQDWLIEWEGHPTAFAFRYPYLVAFDTSFIEIRNIDTGDLAQVIPGNNIRCLKPDPSEAIHCVMDDGVNGTEFVFQLRFISEK